MHYLNCYEALVAPATGSKEIHFINSDVFVVVSTNKSFVLKYRLLF
jgi:hypothetical protein